MWVILAFVAIGVTFIPIGAVLTDQAKKIYEQAASYDANNPTVSCRITTENQGYTAIQNNVPMSCQTTFTLDRDIPASTKLNIYYELTNFYQNHRRYVKSRNDKQCAGQFIGDSTLETSCDPAGSFKSSSGTIYAPCGLIATSYFNDAFFVTGYNGNTNPASLGVGIDMTNIAWRSDVQTKFANPVNPVGSALANQPLNNWAKYRYIWQTYDQMSCYDGAGVRQACITWAGVTGILGLYGNGCAKCAPAHTAKYQGGVPPPGGPQIFDATPGALGNASAPFGFRDEGFIVWMRTAGLPTFRKLYGVVTPPPTGFARGDTLTFDIVPNFEVYSFNGTKSLVLSTVSPTVGKSDVLGTAYLVVGSLCLALAVLFAIKQIVAPRKLGDTQYIVWRQGKQ